MTWKSEIVIALLKFGLLPRKSVAADEVLSFIERVRRRYISVELQRIGGDMDGGYLVPSIFSDVRYCFSPGVDDKAQFEGELAERYGIKTFMADASVSSPPFQNEHFVFDSVFLGATNDERMITLNHWIDSKVGPEQNNMLLQMDIEGSEYEVLAFESIETLKKFSCMIIEFHAVERVFDRYFLCMISGIFEKLFQEFSICHLHPNNVCGVASVDGIQVPRVIEVTFLRNDYADRLSEDNEIQLPHPLDRNNASDHRDMIMPEAWWKSPDSKRY